MGETLSFNILGDAASAARAFRLTADTAALAAKGAKLCADAMALQGKTAQVSSGATLAMAKADNILTEAEHGLAAGALEAEYALKAQAEAAKQAAVTNALVTAAAGAAGGVFGVLGRRVNLFGGALTGVGVPAILATAGGLHILLDAAVETAAVLVPASIALGAFGVAAIPTLQTISTQMQAVRTTSTALGQNIYPLTGGFQKMADAVQPEVYTLFGEALVVAQRSTGVLTTIAVQAGKALDTMGARAAVALTSGGFGQFLSQGPADLAKIGDIIGNIFGTVGNLLRVMPGYAQVLLGALDGVTKGIEALVGSPIGQWAAGAFLAFHGFVLWGGLAATAAVWLGNALVGLAAKFGLAEAGALSFDAAQFGTGIKLALSYVGDLGVALVTMAGAEDVAAASSGVLAGAFIALDAVNPLVWVGLAAAAIGGLVYWMTSGSNAASTFVNNVQSALKSAPASQLGVDLTRQQATATSALNDLQQQAAGQAKETASAYQGLANTGTQSSEALTSSAVAQYRAQTDLSAQIANYKALLPVLAQDQSNYSAALLAAGGNTSFLTGTSISLSDAVTQGGQTLKQYEIEVQANADAQRALGLGVGRSAAALNAQTNTYLTSTIPAMQKVITAEDQVISVITGGQTAFNSFQQSIVGTTAKFVSPSGLADAAKLAGGNLSGLGEQSLAFSNTLYNISIPALQKTVGALQQQGISTGDLTKVIATGAGEILKYTGNNTEARAVIVGLINNALDRGTVSLQTLNKWVGNNSTSLTGFNAIVAKSTIAAGTLANVLQTDLTAQFQAALLKSSGATAEMGKFTDAIVHGGTQTQAYKSARAQLIQDLINTGMNATDAKNYVNGLQNSINAMQDKTVNVGVDLYGAGLLQVTATGVTNKNFQLVHLKAAGGMITGGTPGRDSVLAALTPGEVVVPEPMVSAGAVDHLRGKLPGFASGGIVDAAPWVGTQAGDTIGGWAGQWAQSAVNADIAAIKAAYAAAAAKAKAAIGTPRAGNVSSNASIRQEQMYALSLFPGHGWPAADLAELIALWNQESGWNPYAVNPASGAAGIAQSLGHGPVTLGDWQGQIQWGENYIASTYGSPVQAWAHEVAHNWYAKGGLIPGFAAGGSVGAQGAAFLKAWQTRRGGGFGAAWGPVPVNQQLAEMDAWQRQAATLAGAHGLTSAQHRHYVALAALDKRKAGVLTHERDEERAWRTLLGASDATLSSWIGAAGTQKSLQPAVKKWKAQEAAQAKTIGAISKMLGWPTAAQNAAAARGAARGAAGGGDAKPGASGPAGPAITHTYGTVTDVIEAFLQAHAAPLGAALGGLVMDRGGWLKTGWNPPMYNGTGRPEHLVPARASGGGGTTIVLEASSSGSEFDAFLLAWMRKHVKVKGGGSVQHAFGSR